MQRIPVNEIEELKNQFVRYLAPVSIYLFGSYATGTYTEDSDFDFYIIVNDEVSDLSVLTTEAYRSIRRVKQRPVDIIVGTKSRLKTERLFFR